MIMSNVNAAVAGLQPYQPGKSVEELARQRGVADAVKLASNENPRGPGPLVRNALATAANSLSRYPDGSGFRLKAVLAERLGVETDRITWATAPTKCSTWRPEWRFRQALGVWWTSTAFWPIPWSFRQPAPGRWWCRPGIGATTSMRWRQPWTSRRASSTSPTPTIPPEPGSARPSWCGSSAACRDRCGWCSMKPMPTM